VFWDPNQGVIGVDDGGLKGYYYNFQWLGAMARVSYPAQKTLAVDSYSFHDGNYNKARYCCNNPVTVQAPQWNPPEFFNMAFVDGHVKTQRLDKGCGNPAIFAANPVCNGYQDCSAPTPFINTPPTTANYVCSGSGNGASVPDFP
jgi:prepilin-type processing-associated H-X9-DG protein